MNVRQRKLEMIEAMNRARALEPSSFVPNKLLDTLIERLNLKNDADLCRLLEVQPPIISKIRTRLFHNYHIVRLSDAASPSQVSSAGPRCGPR